MTTQGAIVKSDGQESALAVSPQQSAQVIVDTYAAWSNVLMKVVNDKGLYTMVGDKKYLQFEAWQLIATFDRAGIDTSDVRPIMEGDEITGYICHAKVVKDGVVVAAGSGMCGLDSFPTRGKQGFDKHRAAMSAAQTWAGSKAGRMKYSAVAVMGGFGAASAEEMREAEVVDTTQHYCVKHKTNWFKKGRMKGYGHAMGEGEQWCYESSSEPGQVSTAQRTPAPLPAKTDGQDEAGHTAADAAFERGLEKGKGIWTDTHIAIMRKEWPNKSLQQKRDTLQGMAKDLGLQA